MRIMQLSGAKSSILNTGLGTKNNKHGLTCYLLNTGLGLQLTAYTGSDVLTTKKELSLHQPSFGMIYLLIN